MKTIELLNNTKSGTIKHDILKTALSYYNNEDDCYNFILNIFDTEKESEIISMYDIEKVYKNHKKEIDNMKNELSSKYTNSLDNIVWACYSQIALKIIEELDNNKQIFKK
ncbi:hypothetical protein CoNPh12_CDS0171 [Staphylococcus phage S-CoN_Ph12]|nr:hypothetical protein CoNPh12_CDS0171 [Staphylococcus phage S-CoN_Ph12]